MPVSIYKNLDAASLDSHLRNHLPVAEGGHAKIYPAFEEGHLIKVSKSEHSPDLGPEARAMRHYYHADAAHLAMRRPRQIMIMEKQPGVQLTPNNCYEVPDDAFTHVLNNKLRHECRMIHGDLRIGNFLLNIKPTGQAELRLVDFAFSEAMSEALFNTGKLEGTCGGFSLEDRPNIVNNYEFFDTPMMIFERAQEVFAGGEGSSPFFESNAGRPPDMRASSSPDFVPPPPAHTVSPAYDMRQSYTTPQGYSAGTPFAGVQTGWPPQSGFAVTGPDAGWPSVGAPMARPQFSGPVDAFTVMPSVHPTLPARGAIKPPPPPESESEIKNDESPPRNPSKNTQREAKYKPYEGSGNDCCTIA